MAILCAATFSFSQTTPNSSAPKPKRPPYVEVPREAETGEADADRDKEEKENDEKREAEAAKEANRAAESQAQANPATMPEYPTEIVATVKEIKPYPIENVRLNQDVPSSSKFLEVRVLIHKAVPAPGNRDALVEPGAEVALITRDPITRNWVGKKLTGLVRLQGDTQVQQRFLSSSKLVSQRKGTEHSK